MATLSERRVHGRVVRAVRGGARAGGGRLVRAVRVRPARVAVGAVRPARSVPLQGARCGPHLQRVPGAAHLHGQRRLHAYVYPYNTTLTETHITSLIDIINYELINYKISRSLFSYIHIALNSKN